MQVKTLKSEGFRLMAIVVKMYSEDKSERHFRGRKELGDSLDRRITRENKSEIIPRFLRNDKMWYH